MGKLTDDLRFFLGERRYAVLATHDSDRDIHLTPIWFLFENDRFHFASSSRSRKVKNVERNVSASVVVEAREPGRERWVSASGPVEIVRGAEARSINARIRRRYLARKHSTVRSRPRSPRRTTSRSGSCRRPGGRGRRQSSSQQRGCSWRSTRRCERIQAERAPRITPRSRSGRPARGRIPRPEAHTSLHILCGRSTPVAGARTACRQAVRRIGLGDRGRDRAVCVKSTSEEPAAGCVYRVQP